MKLSEIFAFLPIDELIEQGILEETDTSERVSARETTLGVISVSGPLIKRVIMTDPDEIERFFGLDSN